MEGQYYVQGGYKLITQQYYTLDELAEGHFFLFFLSS